MALIELGRDRKIVGAMVALAAVAGVAALVRRIREELREKLPVPEVEYRATRHYLSGGGSSETPSGDGRRVGFLTSAGMSNRSLASELSRTPAGQAVLSSARATFGSNPTTYQIGLMRKSR
jgi:hypothetical protein